MYAYKIVRSISMFDDKPHISKEPSEVYICLASGKEIRGSVYLKYGERIIDLLNDERNFIPVYIKGKSMTAIRKFAIEEMFMDIDVIQEEKTDIFFDRYQGQYNYTWFSSDKIISSLS